MRTNIEVTGAFIEAYDTPFRAAMQPSNDVGWEVYAVPVATPPITMVKGLTRSDAYLLVTAASVVYKLMSFPGTAERLDWNLADTLVFDLDINVDMIKGFIDKHELIEKGFIYEHGGNSRPTAQ